MALTPDNRREPSVIEVNWLAIMATTANFHWEATHATSRPVAPEDVADFRAIGFTLQNESVMIDDRVIAAQLVGIQRDFETLRRLVGGKRKLVLQKVIEIMAGTKSLENTTWRAGLNQNDMRGANTAMMSILSRLESCSLRVVLDEDGRNIVLENWLTKKGV